MTRRQPGEAGADTMLVTFPAGGRQWPALDGLRGIAIILVLMSHTLIVPDSGLLAWVLRNATSIGWIGVDLFFALSGYLIVGILLRSKGRPRYYRNFYARRALRILPLYLILVGLVLAFSPLLSLGSLGPIWPFYTFAVNLWVPLSKLSLLAGSGPYPALAHIWSLAIEVQFYLGVPVVVALLDGRRLRAFLWGVVVLSPLVRLLTNALIVPGESYFATFCRLDVFAMGGLVAEAIQRRPSVPSGQLGRVAGFGWALAAATLVLWVTRQLNFAKPAFNAAGLTIVDGALAMLIVNALASGHRVLDAVLRLRPLRALGRISYGVYLIHYPVVLVTQQLLTERPALDGWGLTVGTLAISMSVTLVLALLSWSCIERPILRLKRLFEE